MLLKIRSPRREIKVIPPRRAKMRIFPLIPLLTLGLWFGYKQLQSYFVQPEAIFVLGGHEDREHFAAQLALKHPNLPIWVSSGSPQGYATKIFTKAGVKSDRLHLDYHAKDTVTNFTTLVKELKSQGIDSVYLITSDNHMNRARVIGEIVFGSQGIVIKPIAVPSHGSPEPLEKIVRDGGRSLLWLLTGKTGENLIDP
ncbi:YdcF family protein [Crocosphaera sp. UHCC 0190]|uniref:YdcF family protein n=1 Tax=Crocosphaera sp. UHCC 0190 TaxID=3110246 RepID=UPI002B212E7C|nr:YdcF family protein [Crocosphaera sp. UHCC 0190]MEA5510074.1 YdcF family protein [Crocosphaera sp. UHCC 0190]